ncbi:hypothetical protein [Chryseobacterium gambrini]|uniref:hypothetical protein n=1 Tax=Chryseobacterium gambrini TaxID=373672 RepID=UPI003D095FEB
MKNQQKNNAQAQQSTAATYSNVAMLDVKNPIPFEPSGESSVFLFNSREKGYLKCLDSKDNFFQLLLEAKKLSPTNSACVDSKTNFCIGNGMYIKDGKEDSAFDEFRKRVNKKGQSLDKLVRSIFDNHFTAGNNFIEVIRGKVGNKKFMWIVNRSFLDCRLSVPDDDDICQTAFISREFRKKNSWILDRSKSVELPIYYGDKDMQWFKSDAGTEHCIFHIKNEVPGYDYYGMPSNMSSLPQQILEYQQARFNLDLIGNNMILGGILTVEGNLTQEEGRKLGKDIISAHTGEGKRGRIAIATGNNMKGAAFHQFQTQQEGSFLKLDESVSRKIVDSNNWDKSLYGQHADSSGMGNGGFAYLSAVFDTKNKTVIEPTREIIKQDFLNPFFELYDEWMGTNFSDLDLAFRTVSPASFIGEIDVNACLTKDEGREILGKPELEDKTKGQEFISTSKSKKDVSNQ